MGDDPRVVDPGQAPTPFNAAEIRTGCPEGRAVTIRYVDSNGQVTYWTTTFTKCEETGTVLVDQEIDEQGQPIGETSRLKASWDELRAHASFPMAQTTISRETIETRLGELDCHRYEVDDGESLKTLWFATELPGLPIKTQEGKGAGARLSSEVIGNAYA
jgi:hypothetical protein